jgi:hypothetical protein
MSKLIPIPAVVRKLKTGSNNPDKVPPHRSVYARVLDGELPAEKVHGRWHAEVMTAALYLGIDLPANAAAA